MVLIDFISVFNSTTSCKIKKSKKCTCYKGSVEDVPEDIWNKYVMEAWINPYRNIDEELVIIIDS